jgi:hypothetical protein
MGCQNANARDALLFVGLVRLYLTDWCVCILRIGAFVSL